ncbi:MAG: diacylglycerol/lipid kinase family protein [Mycobacterium leprae]
MSFRRVAVVYNPKSGRPRERERVISQFVQRLHQAGQDAQAYATQHPNHATQLAQQAIADGCDLVIAHGGDGTMNEVLQAVAGTDATLGFWPGGTANVLAVEIGFPRDLNGVLRRVLNARTRQSTVGKANDRYFLLMTGIGLDAAVAAGVQPYLKERLGKGAFAVSAIRVIHEWNLPPLWVELEDGERIEGRFIVAGNAHSYGGGFQFTPRAKLEDPHLDLCIFESGAKVDYIKYVLAAPFGAHLMLDGVTYRKVRKARVMAGADHNVPVQLDGEVAGALPLTLESIPEGVKLLV